MNLVIMFGAQAVGKMTVGEALANIADLKLFHNHMSIELGLKFAKYGTPLFNEINGGVRELVLKACANHGKGLIFTYVWALDQESDWEYIEYVKGLFKGYDVYFVELVSDVQERLKRNTTEKRLLEKPSKRDLEFSRNDLLSTMEKFRLISEDGEFDSENYMKIDNTNLSARETANMIKERFEL